MQVETVGVPLNVMGSTVVVAQTSAAAKRFSIRSLN